MFLFNKYTKWYFGILMKADARCPYRTNNRKKAKELLGYVEGHHMLPISICPGFKKEKWNKVWLTAREHFICHRLLTKFTLNNELHQMKCAINGMMRADGDQERYVPTSRTYSIIKQQFIASMTAAHNSRVVTGDHYFQSNEFSEFMCKKQRELVKKGDHHWLTVEHSEFAKGRENEKIGRGDHPFQKREVITRAREGSKKSIQKRLENGTLHSIMQYTCDKCHRTGKGPNFKRNHFNNCKCMVCDKCEEHGFNEEFFRRHFENCKKPVHRYNNGIIEVLRASCPEGFVVGRLTHWYNNGTIETIHRFCPTGYVLGRLPGRKLKTK